MIIFIKNGDIARLVREWLHPINPTTNTPQSQPTEGMKTEGKQFKTKRQTAAQANKEALFLLFKPTSAAPSKTYHQDRSIDILNEV